MCIRDRLGAGNRDPEVFAEPNRFDIFRTGQAPFLSFGMGRHFCIGSTLVRFEGELALNAIADRWPDLQLVTTAPVKDPARHDRYLELLVEVPR